jgi:hypothetical protein
VPVRKPDPVQTSTSQTSCMLPLVGCINAAEKYLGISCLWRTVNSKQRFFYDNFLNTDRRELERVPELESIASHNSVEINDFLQARGFSIKLEEFDRPDFLALASVLKVLVEWLSKGVVTNVRDGAYPAVRLRRGLTFYSVPRLSETTVVSIETKSRDVVNMAMLKNPPTESKLAELIAKIDKTKKRIFDFDGVVFPMIDYNCEVDISWMQGMHTRDRNNDPFVIGAAIQQTKFRMNEIGAKLESAAAMVMRGTTAVRHPDLIIDQPFVLWISRPGLSQPLFVAHFTEEVWKQPPSLE